MTIIIETITAPNGAICVVPSERYLARLHVLAARQAENMDMPSEAPEAVAMAAATAAKLKSEAERVRAFRRLHHEKIQRVEYPVTPYSYGQKLTARDKYTAYDRGVPSLDGERFCDELTALALGMSNEQFYALSPAIAEALRVEVAEVCEPSTEKIDFLFLSPTTSPKVEASPETAFSP